MVVEIAYIESDYSLKLATTGVDSASALDLDTGTFSLGKDVRVVRTGEANDTSKKPWPHLIFIVISAVEELLWTSIIN
jgi:hypothetical protein